MTEQNKQKGLEWQEKPFSDNERLKTDSNFLRGTILDDLEDSLTGGFRGDNFQLIRFHGMYEQDDRDIRAERAEEKLEPIMPEKNFKTFLAQATRTNTKIQEGYAWHIANFDIVREEFLHSKGFRFMEHSWMEM